MLSSVELFGMPGCGKSTVTKLLASQLTEASNMTFVTRKDISKNIDRMYKHPFIVPIIYLYHYLFLSCWLFKKHLRAFAKQYPLTRHRMIYEVYCIVLYDIYKKGLQESELLLLDEGFIQYLSSISHGVDVRTNKSFFVLMQDISAITKETMFVDCQLDTRTTIQRIKVRGKQDRFGHSEDLLMKLNLKQRNIDCIASAICPKKRIVLHMQAPSEYNTRIIKNLLYEKN